jgi:hypothetical protein
VASHDHSVTAPARGEVGAEFGDPVGEGIGEACHSCPERCPELGISEGMSANREERIGGGCLVHPNRVMRRRSRSWIV